MRKNLKKTKEKVAWFNSNNYSGKKLKKFTLLQWWEQLIIRAFVRLKPCCEIEGAQYVCNVTWVELCRIVRRVSTLEDFDSDTLDKLLGCFSLIVRTIFFLRFRNLKHWETYQEKFIQLNILELPIEVGIRTFLENLSKFDISFLSENPAIQEPETFLNATHMKQGEIIKMIESEGLVDFDDAFRFGDWIYSFPLHWASIQKKIRDDALPPIRFASAEEISNFAGNNGTGVTDCIPVTRKGRVLVSVPVGLADQILKDSFQEFLHALKELKVPQRDSAFNLEKWIECGLLQCLDLNHWNDRNSGVLTIQNIIDAATPRKGRDLYNFTTKKWMVKALSPDFLSALLERGLLEKNAG